MLAKYSCRKGLLGTLLVTAVKSNSTFRASQGNKICPQKTENTSSSPVLNSFPSAWHQWEQVRSQRILEDVTAYHTYLLCLGWLNTVTYIVIHKEALVRVHKEFQISLQTWNMKNNITSELKFTYWHPSHLSSGHNKKMLPRQLVTIDRFCLCKKHLVQPPTSKHWILKPSFGWNIWAVAILLQNT